MARKKKQLGAILVEWGVVTTAGVEEALQHARKEGMVIGESLVSLGLADEEDVAKALATQFDMEYVDLEHQQVVPELLEIIPPDIIRRHLVLPITREGNHIKVVITDPLNLEMLDMLRFRLNAEIECALASKTRLRDFVERFVGSNVSIDETVHQLESNVSTTSSIKSEVDVDTEGAPVIRLVTMLITEAVNLRASDIHIEPMSNRIRVRYRIDGVCKERDNIPKRMQGSVINRIKIMAGVDLAEKRLPTDGRITMVVGGSDIDFRVSFIPGYHGESVVLRILRPESARMGIAGLGFEEEDNERFNRIIKRPNGIFLVTGPTGSGKTTTLYAALNELNRPDRKIITAEDPIEYNFTGINQCQVNEATGLTFAKILRSMLRQAPNIILVGEIRDLEVAEVAIQAALTGHLVFSTLHTNDAPSAITRLIDIGVKPFLAASSIQAVLAQRLVRVICSECKEIDPSPDMKVLRVLGFSEEDLQNATIYRGAGCASCGGGGYSGRLGIFELMEMNHALAELAIRRAPLSEVRQEARASGMRSLLEDGRRKIIKGITTPEELVRITQVSELVAD
ncbi:MAG: Flp pilus assembly complex ATPase component TadA [Phycisphaerae bacterium]|nr:Flp pilus assembly complex ATPase component TadA [Phycisphaerae bacterium]